MAVSVAMHAKCKLKGKMKRFAQDRLQAPNLPVLGLGRGASLLCPWGRARAAVQAPALGGTSDAQPSHHRTWAGEGTEHRAVTHTP